MKGICAQMPGDCSRKFSRAAKKPVTFDMSVRRRGHSSAEIALDHAEDPMREVPELSGKLGVVSLPEPVVGKVAVIGGADVPQQVIAQRICAELRGQRNRIDRVAGRLADLP